MNQEKSIVEKNFGRVAFYKTVFAQITGRRKVFSASRRKKKPRSNSAELRMATAISVAEKSVTGKAKRRTLYR